MERRGDHRRGAIRGGAGGGRRGAASERYPPELARAIVKDMSQKMSALSQRWKWGGALEMSCGKASSSIIGT
eukprot:5890959-Pyramimonas_sp.AAC.1